MLSLPIKAVFEDERDVCTAILSKDGETVTTVLADQDGNFPKVDVEPGEYMVRVTQNDEPSAFDHEEKGRCSGRMKVSLEPAWVDRLELAIEDLTRRVRALENAKCATPAEAMLDELETVKTKLDERPDYKFKVNFLQSERLVDEGLSDADTRLFDEYSTLELNRPLEPGPDARWRLLRDGLFDFKG